MLIQKILPREEWEERIFVTWKWLYDLGYRDLKGYIKYEEDFETYNMIFTYTPTRHDILFKVFEHDGPRQRRRKLLERKF